MEYGLIGAKLGHSYSKLIHEALCGYEYTLCPLPTQQEAEAFLQAKAFKAINVTIPYKQLVIPHCAVLDETAQAIGAVNTVVNQNGTLHGYNTDYDGFLYLANQNGVEFGGRTVLILGTGGTSRTVTAVANDQGAAQVLYASRRGGGTALTYQEAHSHSEVQIIVNTSPAGMYPNAGECLVQLDAFPNLQAVLDVVYNPFKTALILQAQARGVPAAGGLAMLVAQAAFAAQHFCGAQIGPEQIDRVTRQIWADRANISLVGMPSCGKTTIGKLLAKALNKKFVDLDAEIEKASGQSIPSIFETQGEAGFRRWESRMAARFGQESGQILSCGGGIVTQPQNIPVLRQNGLVLFIDRPVEKLRIGGDRPLSTDQEALRRMEAVRRPLYEAAADMMISNAGEPFSRAADAAKEAICAYFSDQRP